MFFLQSRKIFLAAIKSCINLQIATNTNKVEDEHSNIAHDRVGSEGKEEM